MKTITNKKLQIVLFLIFSAIALIFSAISNAYTRKEYRNIDGEQELVNVTYSYKKVDGKHYEKSTWTECSTSRGIKGIRPCLREERVVEIDGEVDYSQKERLAKFVDETIEKELERGGTVADAIFAIKKNNLLTAEELAKLPSSLTERKKTIVDSKEIVKFVLTVGGKNALVEALYNSLKEREGVKIKNPNKKDDSLKLGVDLFDLDGGNDKKVERDFIKEQGFPSLINLMIKIFFSLIGVYIVLYSAYVGIRYLTSLSQGKVPEVSEAKRSFSNIAISIILLLTSYLILRFINPDLLNANILQSSPKVENTGAIKSP